MHAGRATVLAVLASALLPACDSGSPPAPRPTSIVPAQGTVTGMDVEISGDHFVPRIRTDFAHSRNSVLDPAFTVTLRPQDPALSEVAFENVRLSESRSLLAHVPAGLERGQYDLRVVDPSGQEGLLVDAFRVLTSAENVAAFAVSNLPTQRAMVPFLVTITAQDVESHVVDGFNGSVTVTDRTGTVTPTTLGPFVSGKLRAEVTVTALSAADALTVVGPFGHGGVSNDFEVRPGFAVELAFTSAGQQLQAGQCSALTGLEARDRFGLSADLPAPVDVALSSVPAGRLSFFSDAACTAAVTAVTVSAGSPRADFHFLGTVAGPVEVRAAAATLPSVTLAATVAALAPTRLDFATPAQALALGACSSVLAVEARDSFGNPSGPAAATPVALTAAPPAGFAFFSDDACLNATAALVLDAATPRAQAWMRGNVAADVVVTATAAAPSALTAATQTENVSP